MRDGRFRPPPLFRSYWKRTNCITASTPAAAPSQPAPAKTEDDDVLSAVEPELPAWEEGVSDPGKILLFADSDSHSQAFLISQMRLNEEFTADLAVAERRKVSAVINAPFLRRKELALLTK